MSDQIKGQPFTPNQLCFLAQMLDRIQAVLIELRNALLVFGEEVPSETRPFQNCFLDCPIGRNQESDSIQQHLRAMLRHLNEVEKMIEEER